MAWSYQAQGRFGSFRILGAPHFGVLIIRILLFRVRKKGPLFSETPKFGIFVRGLVGGFGLQGLGDVRVSGLLGFVFQAQGH